MTVQARDRAYMERLGRHEADGHDERLAAHLRLSIDERLRRSLALFRHFRDRVHRTDDEGPREFLHRAKALGLYRE